MGPTKLEIRAESFQNNVSEKIRETKKDNVNIDSSWKIFKRAVLKAAKIEVGYKMGAVARKPWVTDDMIKN